ncbi:MAG: glycosyltransferase, partial [Thermoanaerobaculia bacterium]
VAFHFSGYLPDRPLELSVGNHRHPVHCDRSLGRLLTFYFEELTAHGLAEWSARHYRFSRFPSGIPIDRRLRELFKEYEAELRREIDPFTPAGEATYCRAVLLPSPGAASLLPLLLAAIYRERADLRTFQPDADLDPDPLLRWFSLSGVHEMGYVDLFDRHRPVVPRAEGLRRLARLRDELPQVFDACEQPLGRDRQTLLTGLEAAGRGDLARGIRELTDEIYSVSAVFTVWRLVREREDLRLKFPDLLDKGAESFTSWLRIFGTRLELLDGDTPARFAHAARGGALARIFSFLDRSPGLASAWPLALAGVDAPQFARLLLACLGHCPEYDLDDVVMYLWLMEERPWSGLPLVLELRANGSRQPSPLLEEGQEALLAPLLASRAEFGRALDDFRKRYAALADDEVASLRKVGGQASASPVRRLGVNLFGFFRSPIGLGSMSRGLASALRGGGLEVRENLLGNLAMGPGLRPEEFLRRYDFGLGTNLFVSFPHFEGPLLKTFPAALVASRRNVAYLAWEQREANPLWAPNFQAFDQVWALSSFAANGLAEALDREVLVVPCAIDPVEFESAAARLRRKVEPGDHARFALLHTFDANSSIERKNPEAVVAAFARAFRPGEPASLWLRIANAQRWPHRRRLRRLAQQASATGLDIRFHCQPLSRPDYLALLVNSDALVSLHRAEGFGMTCAEAMAAGKPTIATGYSGNLEFMNRDNSLLVDFREVEVRTAEGPFRGGSLWAEPSVEHAARQMRWIYENRAAAIEIGERGRAAVLEKLSPAAVGTLAVAALGPPR